MPIDRKRRKKRRSSIPPYTAGRSPTNNRKISKTGRTIKQIFRGISDTDEQQFSHVFLPRQYEYRRTFLLRVTGRFDPAKIVHLKIDRAHANASVYGSDNGLGSIQKSNLRSGDPGGLRRSIDCVISPREHDGTLCAAHTGIIQIL